MTEIKGGIMDLLGSILGSMTGPPKTSAEVRCLKSFEHLKTNLTCFLVRLPFSIYAQIIIKVQLKGFQPFGSVVPKIPLK